MLKKLSKFFVSLVQKFLPDPFIFAVILTFIVFFMGMFVAGETPLQMVNHWGSGFWGLLEFAMQMSLVLVTGHVLANSEVFKKILRYLASIPNGPAQAIAWTTFIAAIACWINWGFGLVIGALLAKEMARQVEDVDYPLLIASAYSGFIVWHAGLAGSIPLTVASEGNFTQEMIGGLVPISETIFSPINLILSVLIIATIPLINRFMLPDKKDRVIVDKAVLADDATTDKDNSVGVADQDTNYFADKIENSSLLSMLLGIIGLIYIGYYFVNGGSLDLNIVIFIFLILGIIFHKTPRRYLNAFNEAVKGAGGIILQFPLYAGIMGMMVDSGLATIISEWFVSFATEVTFPFFAFLSAGIVNFFVPSGGGQWAVQAPVMIPAGAELGVEASKTAMAVAWGDAWTNMIQPFWALPALAIAGLGARDIMGYCIVILIWVGILASLGFIIM
ncbi:MAG: short-chain fatty acid transporter [Halanaerobiales bacterium]